MRSTRFEILTKLKESIGSKKHPHDIELELVELVKVEQSTSYVK